MSNQARGTFDVQVTPVAEDKTTSPTLGRMSIDKIFHGDIEGAGKGEMLTVNSPAGSAVYVAIERVTGTLHGKRGSFALVHQGIATANSQVLTIFVAPDSGSGELVGLSGTMTLDRSGGGHAYTFEYTLLSVS